MADQLTIQSGIKEAAASDMTKYALFMGGTNVTSEVLQCYDPLKTGYARLFMVKRPVFLVDTMQTKVNRFKHILEYGNTGVSGLQDITINTENIQGGYVGKAFEIPTTVSDGMNDFTVSVYEFSGSPVREVIHSWINGMSDILTGLTHYNGADPSIARIQANQTAEFIYVNTDNTGEKIEYACLLANCFPKNINIDVFNYQSGQHEPVKTDISFSCAKYESIQINKVAAKLLDKYKILANSLNLYSGYDHTDPNNDLGGNSGLGYDPKTGQLEAGFKTDTMVPKATW